MKRLFLKLSTYHLIFILILFTEAEVTEELKTLEIMRKFSEQYAKRHVRYSMDGTLFERSN